MLKYKIYYADGTTHSGDITKAPKFGVICILQQHYTKTQYHIVSGSPYYMVTKDSDSWLPVYENDVIDSLVHRPGEILAFTVGQIVSKQKFSETFEKAKEDRNAEALD